MVHNSEVLLTKKGLGPVQWVHMSYFCRVKFNSVKCGRNATADSHIAFLPNLIYWKYILVCRSAEKCYKGYVTIQYGGPRYSTEAFYFPKNYWRKAKEELVKISFLAKLSLEQITSTMSATWLSCHCAFLPGLSFFFGGTRFSSFSENELSSDVCRLQLALRDAILDSQPQSTHAQYINIMYALDSTQQKFHVWIGVASLPDNATSPVERAAQMRQPIQIRWIEFDTAEMRRMNRA